MQSVENKLCRLGNHKDVTPQMVSVLCEELNKL